MVDEAGKQSELHNQHRIKFIIKLIQFIESTGADIARVFTQRSRWQIDFDSFVAGQVIDREFLGNLV